MELEAAVLENPWPSIATAQGGDGVGGTEHRDEVLRRHSDAKRRGQPLRQRVNQRKLHRALLWWKCTGTDVRAQIAGRPPLDADTLRDAVTLSLEFHDNRTDHDDLVLKVGDVTWRCDSYYFALDQGVLAEQEDAQKVRAVLRALLERWRIAIEHLENGGTVYLPYDFSDQCTAWLACEREGADDLLVRHGWAEEEGWAISPSDPVTYVDSPRGFRADGGPWRVAVKDFLNGIARSIEAAV